MTSKTPPYYLRKHYPELEQSFPCEGGNAQLAHVKLHKINRKWLERMRLLTGVHKHCKWLTCPAYEYCDLLNWGDHNPEREEAESMLQAMMPDFTAGRGPFSTGEHHFLVDMLERMESSTIFIPTARQESWLRGLYQRWSEKKM